MDYYKNKIQNFWNIVIESGKHKEWIIVEKINNIKNSIYDSIYDIICKLKNIQFNKLITHEDPYHIHKIFGIYCIINYSIQYYTYFLYNTYNLNTYVIIPHILLHITSFIFKVLPKRNTESLTSMFIWDELRLHSLIFAWRSCFVILYPENSFIISLLTLIVGDIITEKYGTPGVSTVRGNQIKAGHRNIYKELIGSFFSISQFGATIICMGIFQENLNKILVFSTLPPIQTSAFGMTLIRKNIINKSIWNIIYISQLITTYIIWYKEYNNFNIFFISALLYLMRKKGYSKYLIWILSFLIHRYYLFTIKYLSIINK